MDTSILVVSKSEYQIVQKFCFYCPRALGPTAERLICKDCAREMRLAEIRKQPVKRIQSAPAKQKLEKVKKVVVLELPREEIEPVAVGNPDDPYGQPIMSVEVPA